MRRIIVFLLGSLLCLPAAAIASDWFTGGGFQLGGLGRNPGPSSGCTQQTITFHSLSGGEIIGGLRENTWMLYSGLRYGSASEIRKSNFPGVDWKSTSRWRSYQIAIGGRVHVARTYPNPVKPCFGAGITYGWTRYDYRYSNPAFDIDEETESGYSKGGLGVFMELGFMVEIKGPVTPFCFGQLHFYEADFEKDVYTNRDKNESMTSYLMQMGVFVDIVNR
ncbi:hypothetical protein KKH18_10860 [bacterium]|nr:hypothetical protein [bacterium]